MNYQIEIKWLNLLMNYISFKVGYNDDDTPLYFIEDKEWTGIVFSDMESDLVKIASTIYFLEFLLSTKLFSLLGSDLENKFALSEIISEFRENLFKTSSLENIYDKSSFWWRYYFAPTKISYEIVENLGLYYDEFEHSLIKVFRNEIYTRFDKEWNIFLEKIEDINSTSNCNTHSEKHK